MTSSMSGSFLFEGGAVLFYSRPEMVYVALCSNSRATTIGAHDSGSMDKIFRKSREENGAVSRGCAAYCIGSAARRI